MLTNYLYGCVETSFSSLLSKVILEGMKMATCSQSKNTFNDKQKKCIQSYEKRTLDLTKNATQSYEKHSIHHTKNAHLIIRKTFNHMKNALSIIRKLHIRSYEKCTF